MVVRRSLEEYNQQAQPTAPFSLHCRAAAASSAAGYKERRPRPTSSPREEEKNQTGGGGESGGGKEVCFFSPLALKYWGHGFGPEARASETQNDFLLIRTDKIYFNLKGKQSIFLYLWYSYKCTYCARVSPFAPTHTAGYVRISKFSEDAWSPNLKSCRLRESEHRREEAEGNRTPDSSERG